MLFVFVFCYPVRRVIAAVCGKRLRSCEKTRVLSGHSYAANHSLITRAQNDPAPANRPLNCIQKAAQKKKKKKKNISLQQTVHHLM